jgi:hypothetical protein
MPRTKPNKQSKRAGDNPETEPVDLKAKLREKLRAGQLARKCRYARDNRMDDLSQQLESCRDAAKRSQIKKELNLLEQVAEKEDDFSGDYPEYCDTATYGGGLEHNDG